MSRPRVKKVSLFQGELIEPFPYVKITRENMFYSSFEIWGLHRCKEIEGLKLAKDSNYVEAKDKKDCLAEENWGEMFPNQNIITSFSNTDNCKWGYLEKVTLIKDSGTLFIHSLCDQQINTRIMPGTASSTTTSTSNQGPNTHTNTESEKGGSGKSSMNYVFIGAGIAAVGALLIVGACVCFCLQKKKKTKSIREEKEIYGVNDPYGNEIYPQGHYYRNDSEVRYDTMEDEVRYENNEAEVFYDNM